MAEKTKNLCAQIPESLHAKVRERQEESGQTLGQYMTELITKFYEQEGKPTMKENRSLPGVHRAVRSVQGLPQAEGRQAERLLPGLHPAGAGGGKSGGKRRRERISAEYICP